MFMCPASRALLQLLAHAGTSIKPKKKYIYIHNVYTISRDRRFFHLLAREGLHRSGIFSMLDWVINISIPGELFVGLVYMIDIRSRGIDDSFTGSPVKVIIGSASS